MVSGTGKADKYQLEKAVRTYLDHQEKIRPFHASDALALALAGFFRWGRTAMIGYLEGHVKKNSSGWHSFACRSHRI